MLIHFPPPSVMIDAIINVMFGDRRNLPSFPLFLVSFLFITSSAVPLNMKPGLLLRIFFVLLNCEML